MRSGGSVVASFPIPDGAPPAVADAYARFDSAANKWGRIKGELEEAEVAVEAAKLKDAEAIAAAYEKDGTVPDDPSGLERAALAKVAGLRRLLETASAAVDEAGNDMLGPITEARDAWIAELEPAVAQALDDYQSKLAETSQALGEYQRLKAAVGWLERYDAGEARVGRVRGVHPRGPRARVEDHLGREHDLTKLLELASHVGEPTGAERAEARHAAARADTTEAKAEPDADTAMRRTNPTRTSV